MACVYFSKPDSTVFGFCAAAFWFRLKRRGFCEERRRGVSGRPLHGSLRAATSVCGTSLGVSFAPSALAVRAPSRPASGRRAVLPPLLPQSAARGFRIR